MPPIDRLTLRDRLRVMRRSTLARLAQADRLDPELLRLVNDVAGALAALDAEAAEAVAPIPGDWAVVLDDNLQIRIVVYSADRQAACATVSPTAAIRLAGQLIVAASPKLTTGVR